MSKHHREPPEPFTPHTWYSTDAPIEVIEAAMMGDVVEYLPREKMWYVEDLEWKAYNSGLSFDEFQDKYTPIHEAAIDAAFAELRREITNAGADWTGAEVTQ